MYERCFHKHNTNIILTNPIDFKQSKLVVRPYFLKKKFKYFLELSIKSV